MGQSVCDRSASGSGGSTGGSHRGLLQQGKECRGSRLPDCLGLQQLLAEDGPLRQALTELLESCEAKREDLCAAGSLEGIANAHQGIAQLLTHDQLVLY